jgi:hypothetical protein
VEIKPQIPINIFRSRRRFNSKNSLNAKAWVVKAIAEESKKPPDQMWKRESSAEKISKEQLKRIRFLRKHGKTDSTQILITDCLDRCEKGNRCCSGACLECGRLFQRFYVRRSKTVIRDIIAPEGNELIGICIIPATQLIRLGQLKYFSIANFQRRIKAALDTAGVKSGIGGIDFSFNEDRGNKWQPFTCPHIYLIASSDDRERFRRTLKEIFGPASR